MKLVFFGTPDYVVPIVDALHKAYNRGRERQLIAVVTQPPKPVGREKKVQHSPVDDWAFKHNLPIATDINDTPEAQLGVLASYGQIIPQKVIDRFELGIINIHPSFLPEFRGASPIQASILSGKEHIVVTAMKMDSKMDHGPIISTFKEDIRNEDTTETLRTRLFERSAEFIIDLIPNYVAGKIKLKEQNHDEATYTKLINKQDGFIPTEFIDSLLHGSIAKKEWEIRWLPDSSLVPDHSTLERFIRAMNPWPLAYSEILNPRTEIRKRIAIHKAHIEDGKLVMDRVQLEGKNEVSWEEFQRGYPNFRFR